MNDGVSQVRTQNSLYKEGILGVGDGGRTLMIRTRVDGEVHMSWGKAATDMAVGGLRERAGGGRKTCRRCRRSEAGAIRASARECSAARLNVCSP